MGISARVMSDALSLHRNSIGSATPCTVPGLQPQAWPLSHLVNALPLRRLGHGQAWRLSGGVALPGAPASLAA